MECGPELTSPAFSVRHSATVPYVYDIVAGVIAGSRRDGCKTLTCSMCLYLICKFPFADSRGSPKAIRISCDDGVECHLPHRLSQTFRLSVLETSTSQPNPASSPALPPLIMQVIQSYPATRHSVLGEYATDKHAALKVFHASR